MLHKVDVLIINAAGNDSNDIDSTLNQMYPTDQIDKKEFFGGSMTIGVNLLTMIKNKLHIFLIMDQIMLIYLLQDIKFILLF